MAAPSRPLALTSARWPLLRPAGPYFGPLALTSARWPLLRPAGPYFGPLALTSARWPLLRPNCPCLNAGDTDASEECATGRQPRVPNPGPNPANPVWYHLVLGRACFLMPKASLLRFAKRRWPRSWVHQTKRT